MALPQNIARTQNEKINKYLPLVEEMKSMWNLERVIVVPIVIGATWEIPKKLHRSLSILRRKF